MYSLEDASIDAEGSLWHFPCKVKSFWLSFYISGTLVNLVGKVELTGFGKLFTKLKYLGHILAWKFIHVYRYILIIATFV